jgi:hypothetical protein
MTRATVVDGRHKEHDGRKNRKSPQETTDSLQDSLRISEKRTQDERRWALDFVLWYPPHLIGAWRSVILSSWISVHPHRSSASAGHSSVIDSGSGTESSDIFIMTVLTGSSLCTLAARPFLSNEEPLKTQDSNQDQTRRYHDRPKRRKKRLYVALKRLSLRRH